MIDLPSLFFIQTILAALTYLPNSYHKHLLTPLLKTTQQFPSAYRLKPTGGVHAVSARSPIPALSVPHDLCPCHVRLLTAPSAFRAESYLRGSVCSISPPFVFLSTR